MKNKTKIILSSILSIILCASLIAGATFALFTNKSEVNIAVTSATVKVTASVDVDDQKLKYYSAKALEEGETATTDDVIYDENGMGYTQPEVTGTWTNGGSASIGGEHNGQVTLTNITPGDKVEFRINLLNQSNVKIQYRTVVMLKKPSEAQVADLAKVLVICKDGKQLTCGNADPSKDITYYDQEVDTIYSSWEEELSMPGDVGQQISVNGKEGITMSIELPLTIGDEYQTKTCNLYFAVEAVQYNASTRNEVVTAAMKNDLQALNDALNASEGKNNTMYEALGEAQNFIASQHWADPHFISCLKPDMIDFKATDGREFAWDSKNDQFLLMNGDNVIYPTGVTTSKVAIFKLANELDPLAPENNGYSLYLTSDYNGVSSLEVATGLDVGVNTGITSIKYERLTGDPQTVIIRTDGGELIVNAPTDTVAHYGYADMVTVIAVAQASYDEFGTVPTIDIKEGRLVLAAESEVKVVHFTKSGEKDAKDADTFKEITVKVEGELPTFTRDSVDINEEDGTKVAKVAVSGDDNYIWLFLEGIYEQTKVSTVNQSGETVWTDTSDANAETRQVAHDIANNIGGEKGTDYKVSGDGDKTGSRELTDVSGTTLTPEQKEEIVEDAGKTAEEASKITLFAGGSGTKLDPYLIENANQWYNMCTLMPAEGYEEYYTPEDAENCMASTTGYYKIIVDIDYEGWELPYSCYAHDLHIDGNGKKLYNVESSCSLFEDSGDWAYKPGVGTVEGIEIKDFTVSDSTFNYGIAATIGGEKDAYIKNLNYDNCEFNCGIAYIVEISGDCVIDGFNLTDCSAITCGAVSAVYSGNLTIKNSSFINVDVSVGALISDYGAYSYPSLYEFAHSVGDYIVENVTATGCSSNGGAFVHHMTYYGKGGSVLFKNCTIENTFVQSCGTNMATGGIIGHTVNYNGKITLDGCSFQGTVVGESSASGLVGINQSNVEIKNCTVEEGTIIRTIVSGKNAYAFANLSAEKITGDNEFKGSFETSNSTNVKMNGFGNVVTEGDNANWSEYVGIKDSDFEFDSTTGTIKYVGNKTLSNVVITQGITAGYWNQEALNAGKAGGWASGTPHPIESISLKNFKKDDAATLTIINNYANIISGDYKEGQVTPGYFTTTDTSVLTDYDAHANTHTYLKDGVAYMDARPDQNGNFRAWNGTISSATKPTTVTVYITISSLDSNGFVIGSITKSYTFTPSELN